MSRTPQATLTRLGWLLTAVSLVLIPVLVPGTVQASSRTWLFTNTTSGWTGSTGTTVTSDGGSNLHVVFATGGGLYSQNFAGSPFYGYHDDYIRFGYRFTDGAISTLQFDFQTTTRPDWTSPDYMMTGLLHDGQWHWATFNVGSISGWAGNFVSQLRFIARGSGGGGASGVMDIDFMAMRLDDKTTNTVVLGAASPAGWTNGDISIPVWGYDPPPNGFSGTTPPDRYGSGIDHFNWWLDGGGGSSGTIPNTTALGMDAEYNNDGVDTPILTLTKGAIPPGTHSVYVNAADRCQHGPGPVGGVIVHYDPNAPNQPVVYGTSAWTNDVSFYVYWNDPGDDLSGVVGYDWMLDGAYQGPAPGNWAGFDASYSGDHWVQVRAWDAAGNASAWSAQFWMHYDAVPPSSSPVTVFPAGYSTTRTFSFNWGTGSDAHSGVCGWYYAIDEGPATFIGTPSLSGSFDVAEGSHTFWVCAVDCAGNLGNWQDVPFHYYPNYIQPVTGLSPATSQVALPQTFSWAATTTRGRPYVVQVAADSDFTTGVTQFASDVNYRFIPAASAPVNGQTYYWRVACEASAPLNWSASTPIVPYVPPPPPANMVIGQEFPSGQAGEGVNTSLGAVTRSLPILTMRGPGGDLPLTAWYSSQAQRNSLLGSRWNWTLGSLVTPLETSASVTLEDNQDLSFTRSDSAFAAGLGVYDSLSGDGVNGYTFLRTSRERLTFDGTGLLQAIADRSGNAVTLHYVGGVLQWFSDPGGRRYDVTVTNSRVTLIRDVIGRTWQFAYDAAGYLSTFTDANGGQTHYSYDGQGRLTQVTDPLGHRVLRCTYDGPGRVSTQTDALDGVTTFGYDDSTHRTTIMNPAGGVLVHLHDANYRLIADVNERGDTTSYAYDANHNRILVRDALGHTTRYEYDPRGNTSRTIDALGDSTRTLFDPTNSPTMRVDALGHATTYVNDVLGRPTEIDEPLGKVTRNTYTTTGQIAQRTDANNHVESYTYDAAGNMLTSTNGAGNVVTFGYDDAGRQTTVTDGLGHRITYTYDAADSVTSETNLLAQTTSYEFDLDGRHIATVDPRLNRTEYTFDARDRLAQVKDALGDVTVHGYDALDRRIRTVDPRGGVSAWAYDPVGNLLREQDALGNVTTHTYDAAHNRLTTTDARSKTTSFTYDPLGRLTSTTNPLGSVTRSTHDALGRVISTTNARGYSTIFAYDDLGHLSTVQAATGQVLQYGYDPEGNLLTVTNARGHVSQMSYDGADRLVSVRDPIGNTQSYAFDAAGHRSRRTDARGRVTQYSYDAAGRLKQVVYSDSTKVIQGYDDAGNVTSVVDSWGTTMLSYDELNRLSTTVDHYLKTVSFGYDSAGNLAEVIYPNGESCTYTYDAANHMSSVTDWKGRTIGYSYDADDNLAGITHPNGVTTVLTYDDANQLIATLVRTPGMDTLVALAYTLDANGNRTRTVRVDRRPDPMRSGGGDIFATSASLSSTGFAAGVDSIVVTSGDDWPEAVAGPSLARRLGVPTLVVPGDNLWASTATQAELNRLHGLRPALRAVVMGDVGGVSDVVEAQLQQSGIAVRRVRGANRLGTAAKAAGTSSIVVLAGERDYRRAGAAALIAGRLKAPLLLADRDTVPEVTASAWTASGATRAVLVGDESTLGPGVVTWLTAHGCTDLKRHASDDPASLSVSALEDSVEGLDRFAKLQLVDADAWQDAISTAANTVPWTTATLLADPDSLADNADLVRWIGRHRGWLQQVSILGPSTGVSAVAEAELRTLLRTTVTEYIYNALDELTAETIPGVESTSYTYDALGNRASITQRGVTTTYNYDGADRLSAAGSVTYTYDANGNRLTRSSGTAFTSYTYDNENRLIQVVGPEGTSKYRYDGLGRRIRSEEPGRIVRYVVDPTSKPYRTLREMDDRSATLTSYVFGLGLAADLNRSGTARYYHFDGLGSTAALTDSTGTDAGHLAYTAFGDTAMDVGATTTRLGWVGRYGVEGTASGLVFMRDRFYDSETGMFVSQDPQSSWGNDYLAGAMYLYADGNPTDMTDPSGDFTLNWKKVSSFAAQVVNALKPDIVTRAVETVGTKLLLRPVSFVAKGKDVSFMASRVSGVKAGVVKAGIKSVAQLAAAGVDASSGYRQARREGAESGEAALRGTGAAMIGAIPGLSIAGDLGVPLDSWNRRVSHFAYTNVLKPTVGDTWGGWLYAIGKPYFDRQARKGR